MDGIVHQMVGGAISQGSSSTVRGVATCPAVLDHHSRHHAGEVPLAALGAKDVAAKTEVEAALECAREEKAAQSNQQARWSPDAVLEHARCKVRRFEEALKAMGDMQGPEVEFLQDALKRARQAQERPLASQMSEGSSSVQRSMRNARSTQRGMQSFDPSQSPSRGRQLAVDLRRVGRIQGKIGFHRAGARRGIGVSTPATTQLSSTVLASVVPTTVPTSSRAFRVVHQVGAVQRGRECHAPRRLVLVPQSLNATRQSIQDRQ